MFGYTLLFIYIRIVSYSTQTGVLGVYFTDMCRASQGACFLDGDYHNMHHLSLSHKILSACITYPQVCKKYKTTRGAGTADQSTTPELTPVLVSGVRVARSFFVFLFFLTFWQLYCLPFNKAIYIEKCSFIIHLGPCKPVIVGWC